MNEDHLIAAILAAGLIARKTDGDVSPEDAVALYGQCLSQLIDVNRPKREFGDVANG